MIRDPWFWREKTFAARLAASSLTPLGATYNAVQKLQWRMTHTAPAPLPVICVGNANVGGVGKTPFAIMLSDLMHKAQLTPHFLTRGFGGELRGPVRVDAAAHTAFDVGDEALLLSRHAPTWVARNRLAGANEAMRQNADLVIMDDGFQNPSLEKTFSFLLIRNDPDTLQARVLPAGPMREPLAQALTRADCEVVIKSTRDEKIDDALTDLSPTRPTFSCWLEPDGDDLPSRVIAFCGIGAPVRFFETLKRLPTTVAAHFSFPDHHPYTAGELARLHQLADKENAVLLTTQKDFYRLAKEEREGIRYLPVKMVADDPKALHHLALGAIEKWRGARDGAA